MKDSFEIISNFLDGRPLDSDEAKALHQWLNESDDHMKAYLRFSVLHNLIHTELSESDIKEAMGLGQFGETVENTEESNAGDSGLLLLQLQELEEKADTELVMVDPDSSLLEPLRSAKPESKTEVHCPEENPAKEVFSFAGVHVFRGEQQQTGGIELRRLGAAAVFILAVFIGWMNWPEKPASDSFTPLHPVEPPIVVKDDRPLVIASISQIHEAEWDQTALPLSTDIELRQGSNFKLLSGVIELTFLNGTTLVLEAPSHIKLLDDNRVYLKKGKLVSLVTDSVKGLIVETPTAHVVDMGTEFGVEVNETGATYACVFQGKIKLKEISASADTTPGVIELDRGKAGQVSHDGRLDTLVQLIPVVEQARFVRQVDDVKDPAFLYAHAVVSSKPIGYWRFDQINAGIVTNVIGDKQLDARVYGNAGITRGLIGRCISLNGTRDNPQYLEVLNPIKKVDISEQYTIELWCRPATIHNGSMVAWFDSQAEEGEKPLHFVHIETIGSKSHMGMEPETIRYLHRVPLNESDYMSFDLNSQSNYSPNQWHHIVVVKEQDQLKLYMNGELELTMQNDLNFRGTPKMWMGAIVDMAYKRSIDYRIFQGQLDEVAIYNHALSEEEILRHYRVISDSR